MESHPLDSYALMHWFLRKHAHIRWVCSGAAERDAGQAQEAISEFLLVEGDQMESFELEREARDMLTKVRDLRQRFAVRK